MTPMILAGSSNVPLATAIAARLGTRPIARCLDRYPDAELHVVLRESVRDQDIFIVQPTCPPADQHLMELLFLADACRRAGAARVTAVVPYFAYARQDTRADGDVPIGARVVAEVIESVGIARLITMDLHTPELEGFFRIPVEHVSATKALADAVRPAVSESTVIVAPDTGAIRIAEHYQRMLGCPMVVVRKSRLDRPAGHRRRRCDRADADRGGRHDRHRRHGGSDGERVAGDRLHAWDHGCRHLGALRRPRGRTPALVATQTDCGDQPRGPAVTAAVPGAGGGRGRSAGRHDRAASPHGAPGTFTAACVTPAGPPGGPQRPPGTGP